MISYQGFLLIRHSSAMVKYTQTLMQLIQSSIFITFLTWTLQFFCSNQYFYPSLAGMWIPINIFCTWAHNIFTSNTDISQRYTSHTSLPVFIIAVFFIPLSYNPSLYFKSCCTVYIIAV